MASIEISLYAWFVASVVAYVAAIYVWPFWFTSQSKPLGKVLVVVAHPDDECMFFAPSILSLSQKLKRNSSKLQASTPPIFLLSLSTGNHNGLGNVRQKELVESGVTLGIPKENIEFVENDDLKDNPTTLWNATLVAKVIQEYIKKWEIDTVITFDENGVSGHVNHKSVFYGMKELQTTLNGIQFFTLTSVSLWRKYISLLDFPLSALEAVLFADSILFTSTPSEVLLARKAMYSHQSQLVWFRKLYIFFSRYMVINILQNREMNTKIRPQNIK